MGVAPAWLVLTLAVGPPSAAPASGPEPVSRPVRDAIVVEAGATCLDAVRLSAQVAEFRGDDEVDARLGVRVLGGERADQLRFEVAWRGETIVVRDFDPAPQACDELHAVVGVALAIAIDDEGLAEEIARRGDGQDDPVAEPGAPDEPPPVVEPAPAPLDPAEPAVTGTATPGARSGPRGRLRIGIDGVLLVGVIPGASGGAAVGLELGPLDWLDVRVGGLGSFAIDREFAGGLLDFGIGGGQVELCGGGPDRWRVRPRGCAGFIATAVRWIGRGFDVSEAGVAPWLAVSAGADLRVALTPRIGLQLSARAAVPVVSGEYVFEALDGPQTLATAPVAASVAMGPVFGIL